MGNTICVSIFKKKCSIHFDYIYKLIDPSSRQIFVWIKPNVHLITHLMEQENSNVVYQLIHKYYWLAALVCLCILLKVEINELTNLKILPFSALFDFGHTKWFIDVCCLKYSNRSLSRNKWAIFSTTHTHLYSLTLFTHRPFIIPSLSFLFFFLSAYRTKHQTNKHSSKTQMHWIAAVETARSYLSNHYKQS